MLIASPSIARQASGALARCEITSQEQVQPFGSHDWLILHLGAWGLSTDPAGRAANHCSGFDACDFMT